MPAITNKLAVGQIMEGTTGAGVVGVNSSGVIEDPGAYAVPASAIGAGSITTAKLADDAVTQAKLGAGAVGTTELADDGVTAAKIAAGAVGTSEIANDAVTADKLAAGAVAFADLASKPVTLEGFGVDGQDQYRFSNPADTHIGIRGVGGNTVEVYTSLNRSEGEWGQWTLGPVSAAGRRLPLRGAAVTRFYRAYAASGPGATVAGTQALYSQNGGSPGKQLQQSSGGSISWTITIPEGGGVVYIRAMGRPTASQTTGFTATITPASADTVVDWVQITREHNTATTSDFTWANYRIGRLPAGTYTISAADNSTYAAAYITALLVATAKPFVRDDEYLRVAPMKALIGDALDAWTDITGTVSASITQGGALALTAANSGNLYFMSKTVFDRVDITFDTANVGGGTLVGEYWNGSAWTALTIQNSTLGNLSTNGGASWALPTDWATTTVNSNTGYFVRFRATSDTSGIDLASAWIRTYWDSSEEVRALSAEDSEWEPVWCRFENDGAGGIPACDTGSGHGNETGVVPAWFVDGVDCTATLAANGRLWGSNISLFQSATVTTANDGTGTTVGTYRLVHQWRPDGPQFRFRFAPTATTTLNPWAYALMLPVDTAQFNRSRWLYTAYDSDATTLPAEDSGSSITGGATDGILMYSTAHKYWISARLENPNQALFGRVNTTDPSFVAETVGTVDRRLKFYLRASRNTISTVVLESGDTWEVVGSYAMGSGAQLS